MGTWGFMVQARGWELEGVSYSQSAPLCPLSMALGGLTLILSVLPTPTRGTPLGPCGV